MLAFPATATARLVINTTSAPPLADDRQAGFQDLLTFEIFRRIGIEVEVHRLPGERSLINLEKGIDDGTVVRTAGLEGLYPNMRRVPEPMMRWEFVAFAKDVDFSPTDWRSLRPYNVAFINGWKIVEANATEAKSVKTVRDPKQLFGLLQNDRADVVVFEKWQGLQMLQTLRLEGVKLLAPPLAAQDMYMYLHNRHEGLVANVSAAIKQIKEDGTYERLFDETLKPLLRDGR